MTRTAAQDTVVRFVLAMMQLDPASTLTAVQRAWIRDRLHLVDDDGGTYTPLSGTERAKLQPAVLAYVQAQCLSIAAIVQKQFTEEET